MNYKVNLKDSNEHVLVLEEDDFYEPRWKPNGITDNALEWKEKEFKRLLPDNSFSDMNDFALHFGVFIRFRGFNLRQFIKEYNNKFVTEYFIDAIKEEFKK